MKIYTKTGDDGETGLFAGSRVAKNHPRIEAYGSVDELNSMLGLVRSELPSGEVDDAVWRIQDELFAVGAELATPDPDVHGHSMIGENQVARLESEIDRFETNLPMLKEFILPGGSRISALFHLARAVCRRAERRLVTLCDLAQDSISSHLICYLNRLSDLLFVLARVANSQSGKSDVVWRKPKT